MYSNSLFALPDNSPKDADVLLLPLPYDGTACYGKGTARAPEAVWQASTHVELWDEEMDFDLDTLRYHSAAAVQPAADEQPERYLDRVRIAASQLHDHPGLVVGIGGEHSLTPPLAEAAVGGVEGLANLTVVQIDAHSDLRSSYEGSPHSHACAMRRLVDRGARVIAIGIRSAEREEFSFGTSSGLVDTYFAQDLATVASREQELLNQLATLAGDVYLTIDVDGLETSLCPATGTPQPGGLGWWQALRYLRVLLNQNRQRNLRGCDIVETVPQVGTRVNEFTAARLLAKIVSYYIASAGNPDCAGDVHSR